MEVSPSDRWSNLQKKLTQAHKDTGPCGGFSATYCCMCDYHALPFMEDVAWVSYCLPHAIPFTTHVGILEKLNANLIGDILCSYGTKHTHSLNWRRSRVADTPPLLPISRYGYCLFVAVVCLCSEVLLPGG